MLLGRQQVYCILLDNFQLFFFPRRLSYITIGFVSQYVCPLLIKLMIQIARNNHHKLWGFMNFLCCGLIFQTFHKYVFFFFVLFDFFNFVNLNNSLKFRFKQRYTGTYHAFAQKDCYRNIYNYRHW